MSSRVGGLASAAGCDAEAGKKGRRTGNIEDRGASFSGVRVKP